MSLAGCGSWKEHRRIAVIPRLSSDAEWLSLHVGVGTEAARQGIDVYWSGPNRDEPQDQVDLVEGAVTGHAYGIVLRPKTYFAANRVIEQGLFRGIPVAVISEPITLENAQHLHFILNDTEATGRLIAQRLLQQLGPTGEVAIVGLRPEVPGRIETSNAIENALRSTAPSIHIVEKLKGMPGFGYQRAADAQMLAQQPSIRAIVALSANEGFAAASALHAAPTNKGVKLIVCGQTLDLFLLLRAGVLDSLVVPDAREIGRRAVDAIDADHKGASAGTSVLIAPIAITRDNIDTEPIQQMILLHRSPPW